MVYLIKSTPVYPLLFITAFLLSASTAIALPENKLIDVDYHRYKTHETITIFLSKQPEFHTYELANPHRIVVDIKKIFFPEVHRTFNTSDSQTIKSIRISQNQKGRVRVVLDLKATSAYTAEYGRPAAARGHELSIILPAAPREPLPSPMDLTDKTSQKDSEKSQTQKPVTSTRSSDANTLIPPKNKAVSSAEKKTSEESVLLFDAQMPDDLFEEPARKKPGFSMSGTIQTRGGGDLRDDADNEHTTSFRNRVILKTAYKTSLTLSAISDYLFFGEDQSRDEYDIDIHEAFYRHTGNVIELKVGKQIRRWGKTDQISPVDTLNPEDLREFIIPEYEERKIPVWMMDMVLRFKGFSIEGVYIPVFEESKVDYFDSDWAIFTHTKRNMTDRVIPDQQKDYFRNIKVHENDPNDTGLKGEYALKLSGTLNTWDIGATYHYTWEDMPCFTSFPVKNINVNGAISDETLLSSLDYAHLTMENIETEFHRTSITGLFFETTMSDFGIRGEAAWQTRESFLTSSLTSVGSPTLYYILGTDYTSPSEWYINVQLGHKHIFDYDPSILYFKKDTVYLSGEISRKLFFSWLKGALMYNVTLNDNEGYLSPRLEYTYITNLQATLGANIFHGSRTSFLGRFDQDDQLFLDLKYSF